MTITQNGSIIGPDVLGGFDLTYERTHGSSEPHMVTERIAYPFYLTPDGWAVFVKEAIPREEDCGECFACTATTPDGEHAGYVCQSPVKLGARSGMTDADGTQVYFVNVYEIDRAFGGREEGGWWYDCGTFITSAVVRTREEACAAFRRLIAQYPPRTGREIGSVAYDGGSYCVGLSTEPGADYPEITLHYE